MIETIWLKNFRRHSNLKIEFDPQFNVISGRNNAGKTTIFYAIEYCFFGITSGFKKISQLAKIGEKEVGVQLIFKNRKNECYKLQRMHVITSKSGAAKGFFTLKQITNDVTEEGKPIENYIVSSDFGDREEQLSLRLNEILGISKRVFQTAVVFNQGMIPEILVGSPKLDIVFGLTAKSALIDIFNSRASMFMKESQEIVQFNVHLDKSNQEKRQLEIKNRETVTSLENIKKELVVKEAYLEFMTKSKDDLAIVSYVFDKYSETQKGIVENRYHLQLLEDELKNFKENQGTLETLEQKLTINRSQLVVNQSEIANCKKYIDEIQSKLLLLEREKIIIENQIRDQEKFQNELQKITNKWSDRPQIIEQIEIIRKERDLSQSKIIELTSNLENLQSEIRNLERKRGDVDGIIQRRKTNQNNQTCEYCGATIDLSKITQELSELDVQLKELTDSVSNYERKITENKTETKNQIENISQLEKNINELDKNLRKIEEIHQKIDSLPPLAKLQSQDSEFTTKKANYQSEIRGFKSKLDELQHQNTDLLKIQHSIESTKDLLLSLQKKRDQAELDYNAMSNRLGLVQENIVSKFNELAQKYTKIQITTPNGNISENDPSRSEIQTHFMQLAQKMKIQLDSFNESYVIALKEELNDFIVSKIAEFSTSLSHYKTQVHEYEQSIREIKSRIMSIDKDIAYYRKKIELLTKKREIAKNYNEYSRILQEIQNQVRENAGKALQDKILEYDRILSVDDEFTAVHVNPDDYSLSVCPKEAATVEFFPAWLFEGGGHKLILALAYKIALGDIIGKPPFLLIDEPTEFMDKENRVHLLKNINQVVDQSQIFLITHQDVEAIQANKKIIIKRTSK